MKLIPFIVTLLCIFLQFAFGQEKPIATYIPKIVYYTTPHNNGHGFISFKFGAARKTGNSYVLKLYKTHIILQHQNRTDYNIDSIVGYSNGTDYFVTNPSGIKYEMDFLKYKGTIENIQIMKLNKHMHQKEAIMLQMNEVGTKN